MLHADDHIWDVDGLEDHHDHHDHLDDTDEDFKTTTISSESKNQPPAYLYSSHVHYDDYNDHQDDMIT